MSTPSTTTDPATEVPLSRELIEQQDQQVRELTEANERLRRKAHRLVVATERLPIPVDRDRTAAQAAWEAMAAELAGVPEPAADETALRLAAVTDAVERLLDKLSTLSPDSAVWTHLDIRGAVNHLGAVALGGAEGLPPVEPTDAEERPEDAARRWARRVVELEAALRTIRANRHHQSREDLAAEVDRVLGGTEATR